MVILYLIFIFFIKSDKTDSLSLENQYQILHNSICQCSLLFRKIDSNDVENFQMSTFLDIFIKTFWNDKKFILNQKLVEYLHVIRWKDLNIQYIEDLGAFFFVFLTSYLTNFTKINLNNNLTEFTNHFSDKLLKSFNFNEFVSLKEKRFAENLVIMIAYVRSKLTSYKNQYISFKMWKEIDIFDLFFENYSFIEKKDEKEFAKEKNITLNNFYIIIKSLFSKDTKFVQISFYNDFDIRVINSNGAIPLISSFNIIKTQYIGFFQGLKEKKYVSKKIDNRFFYYAHLYIAKIISELSCLYFDIGIIEDGSIYIIFYKSSKYIFNEEEKSKILYKQYKIYRRSYYNYLTYLVKLNSQYNQEILKILKTEDQENVFLSCKCFANIDLKRTSKSFSFIKSKIQQDSDDKKLNKSFIRSNSSMSSGSSKNSNEDNESCFEDNLAKIFDKKSDTNVKNKTFFKMSKSFIKDLNCASPCMQFDSAVIKKNIKILRDFYFEPEKLKNDANFNKLKTLENEISSIEDTIVKIKSKYPDLPDFVFENINLKIDDFDKKLKRFIFTRFSDEKIQEKRSANFLTIFNNYNEKKITENYDISDGQFKLNKLLKLIKMIMGISNDEIYNNVFFSKIFNASFDVPDDKKSIIAFFKEVRLLTIYQKLIFLIFIDDGLSHFYDLHEDDRKNTPTA